MSKALDLGEKRLKPACQEVCGAFKVCACWIWFLIDCGHHVMGAAETSTDNPETILLRDEGRIGRTSGCRWAVFGAEGVGSRVHVVRES
jgi:hypothetical protein